VKKIKNKFNLFKYLKSIWPAVRTWLVKTLLKKFLPRLISGPWGWLITFFGEKIFAKYVRPVWNFLTRKAYAITRKILRKPKAKRLENADNETDFDSSVDDMP
jgi:hypothetical protein